MSYLEIKKIDKYFDNSKIIKSNSFTIGRGELVSIVGESGSGKTTLLRCIAGLENIERGKIFLNSVDITSVAVSKRPISFVFQQSPLFPHLSIYENILFNLKQYDHILFNQLITNLKISTILNKFPHQISGGENQRVAVARSLIRKPSLMLLDEPFNHLDIQIKEKLKKIIVETIRKMNVTTIVVSHNVTDALHISDKILVLQNGEIVDYSEPEKIYKNPSSLYSAKLFGHVNKFKHNDQTILVRPENIFVDNKSPISVRVIDSVFCGDKFLIKTQFKNEKIMFYNDTSIECKRVIKVNYSKEKILNI
ncbi:MAG: ABC transporter ATP-binding protein [Bacteroidota bacterium]|nr:ABC transporter ATP-binding protein [Bacteroidota bacterium]